MVVVHGGMAKACATVGPSGQLQAGQCLGQAKATPGPQQDHTSLWGCEPAGATLPTRAVGLGPLDFGSVL